MMLKIVSTRRGERPSDGSSSISALGRAINARPIASICCSPPDSVPAIWRCRSFTRGNSVYTRSMSSTIAARSRRVYAPMIRLSRTVRREKRRLPSGEWHRPKVTILAACMRVMSVPANVTVPRVGCISPEMVRSVVVLPAPLAPMSATISPAPRSMVTSRSACTRP